MESEQERIDRCIAEVEERYSDEKLRRDLRKGRGIAIMCAFFAVGFCGLANEKFFETMPGGALGTLIGGIIFGLLVMEVIARHTHYDMKKTEMRYARKGSRCHWK